MIINLTHTMVSKFDIGFGHPLSSDVRYSSGRVHGDTNTMVLLPKA